LTDRRSARWGKWGAHVADGAFRFRGDAAIAIRT
jgi:hypothetical protein